MLRVSHELASLTRRFTPIIDFSFGDESEVLTQSLLRTGFTPLPTIIHSPTKSCGGDVQGDEPTMAGRRCGSVQARSAPAQTRPMPVAPVPPNASDSFVADMYPLQAQQQQQQRLSTHNMPTPSLRQQYTYQPTPAYQLTAPPALTVQTHLGPQDPPFPGPNTLPPELQELQQIVSAQTSRLQVRACES